MGLTKIIEEINSGKYNMVFYAICLLFLFHIYTKIGSGVNSSVENMADLTQDQQIANAGH